MPRIELAGFEIDTRPMEAGDRAFVVATWSKGARQCVRGIPVEKLRAAVECLVDYVPITVACSVDVRSTLLGWVAGTPGHTLFVYVPRALRGSGIARALTQGRAP